MRSTRSLTHSLRVLAFATVALIAASCAGSDSASAPVTEAPATDVPTATEPPVTEAPATTDPPATEAPIATEPPVTEAPVETEPPVTEPANTPDITLDDGVGPYAVGVQTITVADTTGGGRDLTVDA